MRSTCLYLGALAVLTMVGTACAVDWPQWRGPERDGICKEKGLRADWSQPPKQLWLVTLPGSGYASPVVADGVIYLTGSSGAKDQRRGSLYALNPATGATKWTCDYGAEWSGDYASTRTTPTISGGYAYLVSGKNLVVCIDVRTGKVAWSVDAIERFHGKNIQWGIAESPLLVDNKVICHPGGPDAAVAALDIKTGATIWTSKGLSDASAYCSPALLTLRGRKQIVTQTADNVVGLNPETGAVLWAHAHHNQYGVHPNTPVAVGPDRVVVASGYGYGAECIRVTDSGAERVWFVKAVDDHFHGMVLLDGRLYLEGSSGPLLCLNPETGAVLSRTEGVKRATLLGTETGLLAYAENGSVLCIKRTGDTCAVTGSLHVDFGSQQHWASPVVANGVLYVRHGEALAAYDLKARP